MTTGFLVEAITYSSEQANQVIHCILKELPQKVWYSCTKKELFYRRVYNITYLVIVSVTVCLRWHSNTKNINMEKRMHLPNTEVAGQLFSTSKMGSLFKMAT